MTRRRKNQPGRHASAACREGRPPPAATPGSDLLKPVAALHRALLLNLLDHENAALQ
ncbi:hypothetical protein [Streptomyces sp. NPDC059761]|uniref:hypothetical protein n=1 Tax=Streptomyces sp. NPDC059761 TaxID=3346937 RepID=UPI0036622AA6